jgi:hypothetical protein
MPGIEEVLNKCGMLLIAMLTIRLITKWDKREGLFNPGTWASHGIIPEKCLGSCL